MRLPDPNRFGRRLDGGIRFEYGPQVVAGLVAAQATADGDGEGLEGGGVSPVPSWPSSFLALELFVADCGRREDRLEGDEVVAVVAAQIEAEIPVVHVVATRVITADAVHFKEVRIFGC